MKNYDEMAQSVFRRRDEYEADRRKKRRAILTAAVPVCCFGLVAVMCIGIWKNGNGSQLPVDNGIRSDISSSSDTDSILYEGNYWIAGGDSADSYFENTGGELWAASTPDDGVGISATSAPDTQSSTADGSTVNDVFRDDDDSREVTVPIAMISSYGDNEFALYEAPENGKFRISVPLKQAIGENGDSAMYNVVIVMYKDGEQVEMTDNIMELEADRLYAFGYTTVSSTYNDSEEIHKYFGAHATFEQILSFNPSDEYGYVIYLYDEYTNEYFN